MHQTHQLSHSDVMRLITAVQARLEQDQLGAAVAVVDVHGELLGFLRTDGCRLPSINIAINKAYTAAREGIESRTLGERSREEGFPLTNFGELRYVSWGGGVPLVYKGQVVGGLGVSGLPEEVDMEIARMAAALL